MRVLILDASAEETQVLASIVNQAFPNVDIVEPTSQVDLPAPSAADPDAVSADRPSPFENDLQAAALFPAKTQIRCYESMATAWCYMPIGPGSGYLEAGA